MLIFVNVNYSSHAFYTRHKMTEYQLKRMKALLAEHGQEHLLQFWDHLDEKQQGELIGKTFNVVSASFFPTVFLNNNNNNIIVFSLSVIVVFCSLPLI